MAEHDIAIIGGGCIGCSIAKHLGENSDLDICVIEKEHHLAEHQSGRNSGVLHPGFNYPPGSLKAKYSTEGTRRMRAYFHEHDLPIDPVGVLVVATNDAEEERLHTIQDQATENGVETTFLDGQQSIREYEPYANGQAALHCPEAASVDSQQYVYQLAADAKANGVDFYMGHQVEKIRHSGDHRIQTSKGQLKSKFVINAAGLHADHVAAELGVGEGYQIIPFRGEYYELVPGREDVCNSMIYPTPDPELPFLGVHYTRRTDGKVIVGPNAVLAFGREAYENTQFDLRDLHETLSYGGFWNLLATRKMARVAWTELHKSYRKERFVNAAQRLVPSIQATDFVRSYAGVRAQLVDENGKLIKDPMFTEGPASLHVLNAVSPGLTSSLPFGEHVANEALEAFD